MYFALDACMPMDQCYLTNYDMIPNDVHREACTLYANYMGKCGTTRPTTPVSERGVIFAELERVSDMDAEMIADSKSSFGSRTASRVLFSPEHPKRGGRFSDNNNNVCMADITLIKRVSDDVMIDTVKLSNLQDAAGNAVSCNYILNCVAESIEFDRNCFKICSMCSTPRCTNTFQAPRSRGYQKAIGSIFCQDCDSECPTENEPMHEALFKLELSINGTVLFGTSSVHHGSKSPPTTHTSSRGR